jgi:dTDP-4-amino-4,6-dideoxygalactose transaminase
MRAEIDSAMSKVLESGRFLLGEQSRAFEAEFAAASGVDDAVAVASGTDAIELALRAMEIGRGDEVVTQANTCVPTVAAIARAGATPVLCDIEPQAATMDPESLARAIGPRTRAVVPVHLYGQCADMEEILAIAEERGVAVVEDCAQAHGALYGERNAGAIGTIGCFSFYPTKNLGALGDAGAVVMSDAQLAERVRLLRHYGQRNRHQHVAAGLNSRIDELQAAILRAKLPYLEASNRRRAEIAAVYARALEGTPVKPLRVLKGRRHVFHLYVVEAPDRNAFRSQLESRGVSTLIHYPQPIHGLGPYRTLANGPVPLSNAERLAKRIASLPLYPELTPDEVDSVATAASESAALAA